MADNICPNVIVNAPAAEATLKGLGWTDAMKTDPILRADVNELLLSSREQQEASCREIEANYGPSGKLVRDLVKPRGTPSTMAGRFPVRSPAGQAISIRAATNFVHTSCPTLDVDKVSAGRPSALGSKKEALYDDSMDADINVQIRVYKATRIGAASPGRTTATSSPTSSPASADANKGASDYARIRPCPHAGRLPGVGRRGK